MTEEFRAWKDEDYRDLAGAGLPVHPAGEIDLASIRGAEAESTWMCVFGITVALSCSPTCGTTVWHGTCNVSTVGCCAPQES